MMSGKNRKPTDLFALFRSHFDDGSIVVPGFIEIVARYAKSADGVYVELIDMKQYTFDFEINGTRTYDLERFFTDKVHYLHKQGKQLSIRREGMEISHITDNSISTTYKFFVEDDFNDACGAATSEMAKLQK